MLPIYCLRWSQEEQNKIVVVPTQLPKKISINHFNINIFSALFHCKGWLINWKLKKKFLFDVMALDVLVLEKKNIVSVAVIVREIFFFVHFINELKDYLFIRRACGKKLYFLIHNQWLFFSLKFCIFFFVWKMIKEKKVTPQESTKRALKMDKEKKTLHFF